MENILNQSYLTMMMGRALENNSNLSGDPRFFNYCEQIETLLNTDTSIDFTKEKQAFAEILDQVRIDQNEIAFDPKYEIFSSFDQELSKNSK